MVNIRQALRPSPQERTTRPHRMIVPVSGNAGDARILDTVSKLAIKQNISVTLVFVVEVDQSMPLDAELPTEIDRGERVLRDAEASATRACVHGRTGAVHTELLQARSAGAAIVDEAIDRNADVIMLAGVLRRKHGRITLGETVDYVLKNAPCEVTLIRLAQPDWQESDTSDA